MASSPDSAGDAAGSAGAGAPVTIAPVVWMLPDRPGRGPRPAHSRNEIAAAAIEIADADGLEAVTMRRVAAEVGCGTMTLYRYVPTKDHLLELMIDVVTGETVLPDLPAGDWREGLRTVAAMHRDTLLRHPWLASLQSGRPSFGPNSLRTMEWAAGVLHDLSLDIDQVLIMMNTLRAFVLGAVVEELAEQEAQRRSGLSTAQWQARMAPYVATLMASGRYPTFNKIITDARLPHSDGGPDEGFALGLELVLDGFAASLPGLGPRS
jgi:AcrR family transcriptional regulator